MLISGVDAAFRPVRLWRPTRRSVPFLLWAIVDDCVRLRLRLLQHFWLGVCVEEITPGTRQRRDVLDDQRLRLYLGGIVSGKVVEYYTRNGIANWQTVWLTSAAEATR